MANYEQKIFEQVIDNYFGETQSNLRVEEEVNLNGVNFQIKANTGSLESKNENMLTKKATDNQKKKRESKSKAVCKSLRFLFVYFFH